MDQKNRMKIANERVRLAMNAGARAIENNKRLFGVSYVNDVFGDNPQEISYSEAAKVLRETEVIPVVHAHWFITEYEFFTCSNCGDSYYTGADSTAQAQSYLNSGHYYPGCPFCLAVMDEKERRE